jgi:diadenosine tetraphosphate (Ap4A) HIT family hydrolase
MIFMLDPRLDAATELASTIAGIEIRVVKDARYYWLMLVPAMPDITEINDLPPELATALFRLAGDLGEWLKSEAKADKINTAVIGNVVSQLHLHIVARHLGDQHWPDPIWGRGTPEPMKDTQMQERCKAVAKFIQGWEQI